MNAVAPLGAFEEIELKLARPTSDPAGLAKRLGRTPVPRRNPNGCKRSRWVETATLL